jgi:hypothetical protein
VFLPGCFRNDVDKLWNLAKSVTVEQISEIRGDKLFAPNESVP